jgi:hypothetical protein
MVDVPYSAQRGYSQVGRPTLLSHTIPSEVSGTSHTPSYENIQAGRPTFPHRESSGTSHISFLGEHHGTSHYTFSVGSSATLSGPGGTCHILPGEHPGGTSHISS